MFSIQRFSGYFLSFLNLLFLILPLWLVGRWAFVETLAPYFFTPIQTPDGVVNVTGLNLSILSRSLGFFGDFISCLPFLISLFFLKRLFKNYQKGNIFSLENVYSYRKLGWLCFWDGLLAKPLQQAFMTVAATLSNPPGHRCIMVSFGTPNLEALFWGILVLAVSWVMAEGYKIQEDQNLTI